jgi:hypothetical protein
MLPEFHASFPHTAEAGVTAEDMYKYINKAIEP